MRNRNRALFGFGVLGVIGMVLVAVSLLWSAEEPDRASAQAILEATGVKGGVIVHVGCGDGRLTAALRPSETSIVHGLDADAQNIARAREHIRSLGLYGKVSAEHWTADRLPYADNLVNLLVSADLGKIRKNEVMRVLAPHGVAYVRSGGEWSKVTKDPPPNTDEWTHYMHDPSGNAVAHDEAVGPPRCIQWTADPPHTRGHEHIPSIYALVSTAGRIFYIADQGSIASVRQPAKWQLMARDAYNGVFLWERPVGKWYPHITNWGQTPVQLQRRLVAVGDRVYVTLGIHSPLSALDAATGEVVKVYEGTHGAEEVVYQDGILLLVIRRVTDERVAELEEFERLEVMDDSPLYDRDSAAPLIANLRRTDAQAETSLLALDAETGRLLWKKEGEEAAGLRTLSLCADGGRVFYQKGGNVWCLDRGTGNELWSVPAARMRVVWDGTVYCADGKAVTALSAETGETRWTQELLLTEVRDAFVAGGSLWLGGFKPYEGPDPNNRRGPVWGPYFATQRDLATGEVLMHVEPENPGHHHRCYSNKATDRYILGGRRGTEFIDLTSGEVLWHSWARGVCRYGVMPSNGLLYTPAHACGCYIAAKLEGFNALSASPGGAEATEGDAPRLEQGAAYDTPLAEVSSPPAGEWATYRHDAERSGCTSGGVPAELHPLWQREVGGKLTSPIVAEGKVLVGSVDEHTICALDADSGQSVWCFTAGARIDSAPTLDRGRAIFGSRDGHVYSVRMSDGALAWRFRAARAERRIAACGQLESASPVLGSVLIQDGVAYCTAGRSSYLDGGIDLCRLEPATGEALSITPIYSPDPDTGRQPKHLAPGVMVGARADILTADDSCVYLRDTVFDKSGGRLEKGSAHLFTLTDFLDDSWPHRSYWIFGTKPSIATGCTGRDRNLTSGRLLVFDESTVYGYGRKTLHWSNQLQDGPYRLFALERGEEGTVRWEKPVPLRVRAMVLADNVLFMAGPRAGVHDLVPAGDEGEEAVLMAISASDGAELAQLPLDCAPVFDGMAATNGRLYISTTDGNVVCMGRPE